MPDPLSESCLSFEMFVESWLHCPPQDQHLRENRNNPPGFCLQWRVKGDSDVAGVKWLFCPAVI